MLTAIYNYPKNGYHPAKELIVGQEYEVESVIMGQSHTSIYLKGYKGGFNSVQFDFYENGSPHNIYRDPRYNPYIRRVNQ